jgi:hypothetical protein
MAYEMFYQWFALSFLFLIANIWGEEHVRFGYILVPFMAAFFVYINWLTFSYLGTVIPIIIIAGILTFLRSHLRYKYGFMSGGGSLLWKIISFIVFMQFAIIFVNGLAIFNSNYVDNPSNEFTSYTLTKADAVYGSQTYNLDIADMMLNGLQILYTSLRVLWSMVQAFFLLYPTMVSQFHVPPQISLILTGGIYMLVAIEVFVLIYKPLRPPEV